MLDSVISFFPFTFRLIVPGLSNPFTSPAPAVTDTNNNAQTEETSTSTESHHSHSENQTETKRLKRNLDRAYAPQPPAQLLYRKHPSPSVLPLSRLARKRGWQPSTVGPSRASIIASSPTGFIDTTTMFQEPSNVVPQKEDDVVLDLPAAKRRKGITEAVITTAFNAALVSAAVGLTVFKIWKERGKEIEQSPPPPYQEEWIEPSRVMPSSEPESNPLDSHRVQKTPSTPSSQKRHASSLRHRPKVTKKVVVVKRELSPKKSSPNLVQDEFEHSSYASSSGAIDNTLDEMDWIGDKLAQLIEEGKRALGKEIVVASEVPEDEIDDGSGNWIEDEPTASGSFPSHSSRQFMTSSTSKRSRYTGTSSMPASSSSRQTTFSSHTRFHSEDLTGTLQSTPNQSMNFSFESGADSSSFMARTYECESSSIRESMDRARVVYLQKRAARSQPSEFHS